LREGADESAWKTLLFVPILENGVINFPFKVSEDICRREVAKCKVLKGIKSRAFYTCLVFLFEDVKVHAPNTCF
jgi:hypothetical protein